MLNMQILHRPYNYFDYDRGCGHKPSNNRSGRGCHNPSFAHMMLLIVSATSCFCYGDNFLLGIYPGGTCDYYAVVIAVMHEVMRDADT